jgi:hypothetical protein
VCLGGPPLAPFRANPQPSAGVAGLSFSQRRKTEPSSVVADTPHNPTIKGRGRPGPPKERQAPRLDQVLEEIAKGDPDQEDYWWRMYAENHPDPARTLHAMPHLRLHPHHRRLPACRLARGHEDAGQAQANPTSDIGTAAYKDCNPTLRNYGNS